MIHSKEKTKINCSICGKDLFVRNDYLKKHKGLCNSCSTSERWKDKEYYIRCSQGHKGMITRKLPDGMSNFNALYYVYKQSAQKRGIFFDITKDFFAIITKKNCYYCGAEPAQKYYGGNEERFKYGYWVYNGIDRLDDGCGYTEDNCVPCCKKCNYAKQGMTDIEFLELVKMIYENHFIKNTI